MGDRDDVIVFCLRRKVVLLLTIYLMQKLAHASPRTLGGAFFGYHKLEGGGCWLYARDVA